MRQPLDLVDGRLFAAGGLPQPVTFRRRQFIHRARGCDDRPVAGTAAQVAGKRVVDLAPRRIALRLVEREHRHHEARRAEAALRTVLSTIACCTGCSRTPVRKAFDRDEFLAVERGQELDTGIDRLREHPAVAIEFGHYDRAGTAVAFGAAFFRAGAAQVFAQELQHGASRIDVASSTISPSRTKRRVRRRVLPESPLHRVQLPRYVV